ncbi:MCP four helix bundle domain-containing protein [Psychroflexus tropicus]|uniref:MCP four helix bundle domain-containing protein n=1 Tax=Psychroflexus tropicus TaxID=197345 RepID=UPI0003AA8B69|nr:MCP four helix bundle domain-containing protein [Psychroflexus tropicus]
MAFLDKVKWILGILMIFGLIITTNLIDRHNFIRVKDSVVTIYEDRLVANDLIFEMLKTVQEKELNIIETSSTSIENDNSKFDTKLESLVSRFEETKLTIEEASIFEDLKMNVEKLIDYNSKSKTSNETDNSIILSRIEQVKTNLDELSKIQLREGSRQMSISKHALNTVELFTQIEIFILIFLAILIQIIVMYKPKHKS